MRAAPSSCLATLAAAICLAGCSSSASRTSESWTAYHELTYGTQPRMERGIINLGDTPDMVLAAMGKPDEKLDVTNTAGYQSVWIYRNTSPQVEHREPAGWREAVVPAIQGPNNEVIQEPVTREDFRAPGNAGMRVAFAAGVVSSVMLLKR